MKKNIILLTDSYKFTHHIQYPKDTQVIYSYFESREGALFPDTVFLGLQYIIKKYLQGKVITNEKIKQASILSEKHFLNPEIFNIDMWEYILSEYDGKLPIRIKAVPEGSVIPIGNVLMTVENTDPYCYPLTNHLETLLSHIWYPSTVCSLSRICKRIMLNYLKVTSDQKESLDFQLHDFGFRGVSSVESAAIGGLSHIINFKGTDTIASMEMARLYYNSNIGANALSVPATEHSVMTSKGKDGEKDIVKEILEKYPVGIVSIVGDSYDIENFVENIIGKLYKNDIIKRNHPTIPCKVVIRPDSLRHKDDTPEDQVLFIASSLWKNFGGSINKKGFKVLDSHVGILWGDGIDKEGIIKILDILYKNNFSTENIVFGMGGGLLQKVNRDTQRFAFKCSARKEKDIWIDIYKDPLDKSKISKKGRLKLIKIDNIYRTVNIFEYPDEKDILIPIFENGELLIDWNIEEIRKRSSIV